MGDIPKYGTPAYKAWQYKRMKEENRGKNFQYWNKTHDEMLENGWDLFEFKKKGSIFDTVTTSMLCALEAVKDLREKENFARVIAGREQNQQRQKMFSVIFKPKKQR